MKTKSKTKLNFILSFVALLIFGNTLSLTVQAGGGCHVQTINVVFASACNDNGTPSDPSDDYYTADVDVYYFDPPLTGNLRIFGTALVAGQVSEPVSDLSGSPFQFNSVQFRATGAVETFFGEFTDEVPACSQLANPPIVQPCSGCGSNSAPVIGGLFTPACGSVVNATVGVELLFSVQTSDPDGGHFTLTSGALPAGSVMSPPLPETDNPPSSVFTWTPGAGDVGQHVVTFTVTDNCGAEGTCSFTIDVSADPCATNTEPEFTAPVPTCPVLISVLPGVPVSFTLNISDIDAGDIVTLNGINLPAGATLSNPLPATGNPVSTTFDWTPGVGDVGLHTVTFFFDDLCDEGSGCDYIIDVLDPCTINTEAHFIAPAPACPVFYSVLPGVPVSFTVSASDDDVGDIVTLNGINIPAGATLSNPLPATGNPVSTTFDWIPGAGDVGLHTVTFFFDDLCGEGSGCDYIIDVTNPCETNIAPEFIAPSPACGTIIPFPVGIAHSFTVSASDAEAADVVTLAATGVPATATLSTALPATGNPVNTTLSWTPAAGDVGQHVVTFSASDACGHQVLCSYTLDVYDCSTFSVNAGADAQSFYGYAPQQTVTHTAVPSGGTPPYTYSWAMSRDLICNSVTTAGDETFSGGTCANVTCPTSGTPASSAPFPTCTGSATINAALLANAVVCVTVTDAGGCIATDCFNIVAEDVRCFAGNSGPKKVKVCHHTNSTTNPWVQICVYKNAVHAHLVANPGDYLGICAPKLDNAAYSEEMEMYVYPNPAQNQVTVEFDSPSDAMYQLSVFDITGRVVMSNNGSALEGANEVILPINDIARGVYNIRLTVGDESSSVRLIVSE